MAGCKKGIPESGREGTMVGSTQDMRGAKSVVKSGGGGGS